MQIGVPLIRLASPRPARFAWQMFSATPPRARFSLVMRDGTRRAANLAPYVAQSRGEMDLRNALPPHLCRAIPNLAAVEVLAPDTRTPRVYACP